MAENDKKPGPTLLSRRSVLDLVLAAGGLAWGMGMGIPAAMYLWPARSSGPAESMLSAGPAAEIAVGQAKMIQSQGKPIIVIRLKEGQFKAFSAICTHLGCVVQWDAGRRVIACPCHAGEFSTDGKVIAGPPPKGLAEYPVTVVGAEIKVKVG